jgi:phage-related protein
MKHNSIRYFKTEFYPELKDFFRSIERKAVEKIFWNIDLAERTNDPRLFKKISSEIWEFRTKYGNLQYRLLAFWDKTDDQEILVIATHGIIKKTDKMPLKEIEKANRIRKDYFKQKND